MILFWRNIALATLATFLILFVVPASSTIVDRLNGYFFIIQLYVLSRVPASFARSRDEARLLVLLIGVFYLLYLVGYLTFGDHARYFTDYRNLLFG